MKGIKVRKMIALEAAVCSKDDVERLGHRQRTPINQVKIRVKSSILVTWTPVRLLFGVWLSEVSLYRRLFGVEHDINRTKTISLFPVGFAAEERQNRYLSFYRASTEPGKTGSGSRYSAVERTVTQLDILRSSEALRAGLCWNDESRAAAIEGSLSRHIVGR